MSVSSVREIYVCGRQRMVSHRAHLHSSGMDHADEGTVQAMTATSEAQHDARFLHCRGQ